MTFFGFIRKVFIVLAVLVLVSVLFLVCIVLRQLPWKTSISRSDKVWTSDVYTKHFVNPNQWRHIETFVCQIAIPYEQIRPELVEYEDELAAEIFRLFWNARNTYGKVYAPVTEAPTIGTVGGTAGIQAKVVAESDMELACTITNVGNGYMGGLETVEVVMLQSSAMIELKYLWHTVNLPRPWKFQWFGVYLQLMARKIWLQSVVAGVSKAATNVEGRHNVSRDL
ncbi:hypothetical protein BP6252_13810 [Coleophoma cylindrospora]|uniref:Uncharacterized protein n=1 Tax=Coleophoma cylindrospora TaxID=1849047 RepID=A0A3D8Q6L2_9HELO|nr:hypothetical protein BP6252_13810 [Coleophoma cylindrospora]